MSERYNAGFGALGVPILDNSEKARLAYWRQFSTPIPASLLRITGWLDESPEQLVAAEINGKVVDVPKGANPPNVLFRLPIDPVSRRRWEEYLSFLRMHQSRNALVRQLLRQQEAVLNDHLAELQRSWDELFEHVELARDAARRARSAFAGTVPEHVGNAAPRTVETRQLVDVCRRLVVEYRSTQRRVVVSERAVRHEREQLEHTILPGVWSEINSFLDFQCLSTASLASDEFRRRTHEEKGPRAEDPLEVLGLGQR